MALQCSYDGARVRFFGALAAPLLPLLILAACGILELPYPTKGISAALKVQLQELAQHPFRMLESCHGIPFSAQDPDIFRASPPTQREWCWLISMILGPKDKPPTTSWQKVAIENIPGVGKASTVDYLNRQYPYIVAIGVGVTFGLVTDLRWSRSVAGADPSLHRWGFKLCQSPNLPICWWRWWAPGRTRISILVGGLEHFLFFHSVGNFIIPTDELHHFSNG